MGAQKQHSIVFQKVIECCSFYHIAIPYIPMQGYM